MLKISKIFYIFDCSQITSDSIHSSCHNFENLRHKIEHKLLILYGDFDSFVSALPERYVDSIILLKYAVDTLLLHFQFYFLLHLFAALYIFVLTICPLSWFMQIAYNFTAGFKDVR